MNINLTIILRFILLFALQVLIFNNINLLGYINPYPYLLFILLYPVNGNKFALLLSSFIMGLTLDMFLNSGGVHTTASLLLAYIRPSLLKFSLGISYEQQTVQITDKLSPERITFLFIAIIIHHFILFSLEYYRLSLILEIFLRTLSTSIFTMLFCLLIIFIIKPSKR